MRRVAGEVVLVIGLCAVLAIAGCRKPVDESLDALLKQSGQRQSVYPLAGKVTIDGQPPQFVRPQRLIVMLNSLNSSNIAQRRYRQCNDDGEFSFGTYTKDDGVPAGTFLVTFAALKVTPQGLLGPDQLMNLFNDPDKNIEIPQFKIIHQPPGRRDYVFDLKVAGQEPIETPGPHALTEIRLAGR